MTSRGEPATSRRLPNPQFCRKPKAVPSIDAPIKTVQLRSRFATVEVLENFAKALSHGFGWRKHREPVSPTADGTGSMFKAAA
ncbi:hypothetical protein RCH10_004394 [Variovorax sp. GrIS 2.14]|uniref:hypothetical protein n=1 Tax=Variovorax sp. GrIS 2.14 TaxID=3071709 RepID=UPI0038F637E9